MRALTINERGIIFVVAATASFTTCDTLIKLATQTLPVFESMFLRSVFAMLWIVPFLAAIGSIGQIHAVFQKHVALRSVFDTAAGFAFVIGLANMPIAEITALIQLAPILLMIAAAMVLHLRVTWIQYGFAIVAFVGMLCVIQPGSAGFSVFAVVGIVAAAAAASRDLVGRIVPAPISGAIVALAVTVYSTVAAGIPMLLFETFRMPDLNETVLLAVSAFFMICAQFLVFGAYRRAEPGVVAPFAYTSTLWAVISSGLVFGALPNALGFAGIVLIVASGVGVLVLNERRQRAGAKSVQISRQQGG